MKPYNEYLAMTAEQIMADPEAPESLRIVRPVALPTALPTARPALPMALPVSRATFSVPWTMSLAPRVMGLPLRAVLLALSAALPAGVLLALVFPFRFSSG